MASNVYCMYFQCGRNHKTNSDLSFFRFPSDKQKSDVWLMNCGNPDLFRLSEEQLRQKKICGVHFSDKHFMNSRKNRLVHNAIPLHYESPPSPQELILKKEAIPKVYGTVASQKSSTTIKENSSPELNTTPDSALLLVSTLF